MSWLLKYAQTGGSITPEHAAISKALVAKNSDKNFIQRAMDPNQPSVQVPDHPYPSTHLMGYDPGSMRVYPSIVQTQKGQLNYLGEGDTAYDYADNTGEYVQAPTKEIAKMFASYGYKHATGMPTKQTGGAVDPMLGLVMGMQQQSASPEGDANSIIMGAINGFLGQKQKDDAAKTAADEEAASQNNIINTIMGIMDARQQTQGGMLPSASITAPMPGRLPVGIASPDYLLRQQIADKESAGGNYKAANPKSSAVGKYQFLWNTWGNEIKAVTGVKSKQEYLNNPQAQEQHMTYYISNHVTPTIAKLRHYNKKGYSDTELAKLYHFKGEGGAKEWLLHGADNTHANNISIGSYLTAQTGGVAVTPQQQYEGLNNPLMDSMLFPMSGKNTFRGLDNGQPVLVQDSKGKSKVLRGPGDTMTAHGNVIEHRVTNSWINKYT